MCEVVVFFFVATSAAIIHLHLIVGKDILTIEVDLNQLILLRYVHASVHLDVIKLKIELESGHETFIEVPTGTNLLLKVDLVVKIEPLLHL